MEQWPSMVPKNFFIKNGNDLSISLMFFFEFAVVMLLEFSIGCVFEQHDVFSVSRVVFSVSRVVLVERCSACCFFSIDVHLAIFFQYEFSITIPKRRQQFKYY